MKPLRAAELKFESFPRIFLGFYLHVSSPSPWSATFHYLSNTTLQLRQQISDANGLVRFSNI